MGFIKNKGFIKIIGLLWLSPIFIPFFIDSIFSIFTVLFFPLVLHNNLKRGLVKDKTIFFFVGFLVYTFLCALLFNEINEFYFKYLNLFIQGFLVFYFIISVYDYNDVEWLVKWIVFFVFIAFIIGLVQDSLGLGKAEKVYDIATKKIVDYSRPIPHGFDPNYYYVHIILPLTYCLVKFRDSKGFYFKMFFFLLSCIFLYNAVITASKSAMLISVLLTVMSFLKSTKNVLKLLLLSALFFSVGLPILQDLYPYAFHRYNGLFEGLASGDMDRVTSHRSLVWLMSFNHFSSSPLFGIGLGQITKVYSSDSFLVAIGAQTTHNSFLHTLTETGFVGATLIFYPIITLFRKVFYSQFAYLFLALFGILIMIQSIDAMYYKVIYVVLALSSISVFRVKKTFKSI